MSAMITMVHAHCSLNVSGGRPLQHDYSRQDGFPAQACSVSSRDSDQSHHAHSSTPRTTLLCHHSRSAWLEPSSQGCQNPPHRGVLRCRDVCSGVQ